MIWKEIVCKAGRCPHKDCKHHRCHLPQSVFYNGAMVSELEYEIENFPRQNKCPYGEKWIVGKGLACMRCGMSNGEAYCHTGRCIQDEADAVEWLKEKHNEYV